MPVGSFLVVSVHRSRTQRDEAEGEGAKRRFAGSLNWTQLLKVGRDVAEVSSVMYRSRQLVCSEVEPLRVILCSALHRRARPALLLSGQKLRSCH